jgi:outer membrane protein
VDVLGAEVEVAQQELAIARAVGEARKAKLALQETMGAGGDATFALTSEAPPVADPAALDVDGLVARAVKAHPRVREAEFGAEAADRRVEAAARQRWPTLSADVGVGRSVNAADYGAFGDFLTPSDRSLSFGFSGRLPIFNGLQTSAAIARARANRTRAEEAVRAARLEVEREVRSAWIDLEVAYAAVQLAERASALASERLELAQEKYRFGGVSFTDLQLVIDGAARTERQEIAARFEYATALATLEEKVAGPIRP